MRPFQAEHSQTPSLCHRPRVINGGYGGGCGYSLVMVMAIAVVLNMVMVIVSVPA